MDDECNWLQKYLWMSKWERKRKEANSETDRWEIVCKGRAKEQKRRLMNTETDSVAEGCHIMAEMAKLMSS